MVFCLTLETGRSFAWQIMVPLAGSMGYRERIAKAALTSWRKPPRRRRPFKVAQRSDLDAQVPSVWSSNWYACSQPVSSGELVGRRSGEAALAFGEAIEPS